MTARRLEIRLHPDDRIDPGKAWPQVMQQHVTVNMAKARSLGCHCAGI